MNKVVDKPVQISEKRFRHSFRLYHDPSSADDGTKDRALHRLLQEFVDQPALLRCGPGFPEKMAIYHDGSRWIVAAEAEQENA
jgi:uncharacterized protein YciI